MKIFSLTLLLLLLTLFLSCNDRDKFPVIGGHYKLHYDTMNDICLFDTHPKAVSDYKIFGHILFYGQNSEFLIAYQKPWDSIKGLKELPLNEQLNKVYNSNFHQFYILKLKTDSLFGPFNKINYFVMRKKLGVPETLKLDNSTLQFYVDGQRNDIDYRNLDEDIIDIANLKGNKTVNY